jgi:hypothetical protein
MKSIKKYLLTEEVLSEYFLNNLSIIINKRKKT